MKFPKRPGQAGISLIEVLVTLVITSVSLLGMANLITGTLRSSGDAIVRTNAITLVADVVDRMRSNTSALDTYEAALSDDFAAFSGNGCRDTPSEAAADCTPAELAQLDVYLWKQALADPANGVPAGQGAIAAVAGFTNRYQITVQWTDRAEGTPGQHLTEVQF